MKELEIHSTLSGRIAGHIWMPQVLCWKDKAIGRNEFNWSDKDYRTTLRDMALRLTNDGDFQSTSFAWGEVTVTTKRRNPKTGVVTRRTRSWPIERFPSIADMVDRSLEDKLMGAEGEED